MALPITITISITLIHLVIYHKNKRSLLENSIVFFVVSIFIMNYLTIITWNMDFISTSNDDTQFISFLLHRNLITPLIVILFTNTYHNLTSRKAMAGLLAATLLSMGILNVGSVYFQVEKYIEWNLRLALMMDVIILAIGLVTLKFVMFLKTKETKNYEGL
ncbi:hypothetical protein [Alkalihalobacillus sp. R86527]|uniref:hypothetical protein n=1 Tax=Alkalihalobacillus sp. R86527 TaxID=3093863 RepID=UPI00366F7517